MGGDGTYDSRPDTLIHSRRVGELVGEIVKQLLDRSYAHDLSKTEDPEREAFDRMTPRLAGLTYGTPEYFASLDELGPALQHHYQNNRHHPQYYEQGIGGMSLIDLVEMLADWRAASERHNDGDLGTSLDKNRKRFNMDDQLWMILVNTATDLGWLTPHESDESKTAPSV